MTIRAGYEEFDKPDHHIKSSINVHKPTDQIIAGIYHIVYPFLIIKHCGAFKNFYQPNLAFSQ